MKTPRHSTLSRRLQRAAAHATAALLLTGAFALPAFAADGDVRAVTTPYGLAPNAFEWRSGAVDAADGGPVTVVVSLPEQMAYVYRGEQLIGRSTVSSGKPGHDTPPGVYEILEKRKVHHSNKYNNAPMPFMQRLTWDGVALHAGHNPGYPASHGCVRLPREFAATLFEVTERGGRVIVADETNFGEAVLHPGERIPVDPWTGAERGTMGSTASLGAAPATQAIDAAPALAGN
ncbi:L,D-transpeptidase family protein [Cognatilysobacter segetis]|uniref:L,D-transpeptidase family protein n=1 Tax=Cognatilysobacter segetis TaxID=2492394 RepID=UPI001060523A